MNELSFKILEWAGALFALAGVFLITQKRRSGFLILSFFNLLWTIMGFYTKQYGVVFLMLAALIVNTRGYIKWYQDDQKKQKERINNPENSH